MSNRSLDGIVASLRAARRRASGDGQEPSVCDLPSRGAADIVARLSVALFPEQDDAAPRSAGAIDYFVGNTLHTALRALSKQVQRELCFGSKQADAEAAALTAKAEAIVGEFAEALPGTYDLIQSDIRAAFDGDPSAKSTAEILLSYPGIGAQVHHRFAHTLYRLGAPVLARIIAELAHSRTGIDIHPGAQIGGSFFIDHGTGVVIGETAVIGERVRLYQAVTLGAKRFSVDEQGALVKGQPRHPIVEDDVVIYAGATVLGRVTIGRGSVIGGNVWLTRSVPAGSHIVQAQARSEVFDQGAGI